MNKNIFSPKGIINSNFFILYYILLNVLYFVGGLFIIFVISKNHLSFWWFLIPLFFIKLLLVFNYKKRLMDISQNLLLSIILGLVLTFDVECLSLCSLIKNVQTSQVVFFASGILMLIIQPAIVGILPSKKKFES